MSLEPKEEEDSSYEEPVTKKAKVEDSGSEYEDNEVDGDKNDDGDEIFKLSNKRRVTVRSMNGKTTLIDIREYYEKDGKQLPGRKGISLTKDQWKSLKSQMKKIDEAIDRL